MVKVVSVKEVTLVNDRPLSVEAALQRLRQYSEKRAELERMLPGVHQDIRDIYAAHQEAIKRKDREVERATSKAAVGRASGLSRPWVDKILEGCDVRQAS